MFSGLRIASVRCHKRRTSGAGYPEPSDKADEQWHDEREMQTFGNRHTPPAVAAPKPIGRNPEWMYPRKAGAGSRGIYSDAPRAG